MSKETEAKQEQTKEQAQNASLLNLRQQFVAELEQDETTANRLSQQLQALANKREQLRGAIYAMDAAMATLAQGGQAKTAGEEKKADESKAAEESKAEASAEAAKTEAKAETAEAVTAETKG